MAKKINETLDLGNAAGIVNLKAPVAANDAARKADVDAVQTTLKFMEEPVRAVATANINVAAAPAAIDGVNLANGDRVLLTAQNTASENGTYTFAGAGNPLARTADPYTEGTVVFADADGTNYANTLWIQTTANPNPGVSAMTFTRLPFEATSAGTGLVKTGNALSLDTPVAVASGGTGGASAAAAKANLGFSTTYEADFGDGASTTFTINHNLGNKFCSVVVVNNATGQDEDCTITRNSANQLTLSSEAWAAAAPGNNAYHVACRG